MPSNNSKYSPEIREEAAKLIINTGRSASNFTEEMGIDVNTVCRWVRDYRWAHKMPAHLYATNRMKYEAIRTRSQ